MGSAARLLTAPERFKTSERPLSAGRITQLPAFSPLCGLELSRTGAMADYGAIELRAGAGAIAERNEEANRRRLERERAGAAGGPLRVTDPTALARLMEQMRTQAEQQRGAEEAREAERRRREGAAYRTPEQRAEEARKAREAAAADVESGDEARVLEKRFDPSRDYYALLGIPRSASAAEVKKAYKKLALLHHPDKHKGAGEEQQAAVADKFKQIVEAFDVLSNEEKRALYDKIRDFQEHHPGRGLPVLSDEEKAMMRSGIAELARLRRMGAKAVKHAPLEREVFISLEKLNHGCTKTVPVERRRVRPDGAEFMSTKNIHLVVRRGSREGDKHLFENDGCEGVDTMPGDLVITLRAKPHPVFRRCGPKDLEIFAAAVAPGDVMFAVEVATLTKRRRPLLVGSALREAAANGGAGGTWQAVLRGEGLYDAADPWEQPAGDLTVRLRYPACLLAEARISCCLAPAPVHLLGSGGDAVSAALAAGSVAGMLGHRREVAEMAAAAASGSSGSSGSGSGSGRQLTAMCVVLEGDDSASAGGCGPVPAASPAAAAMLRALQRRVPGLQARTAVAGCMLDEQWAALGHADVVILDLPEQAPAADGWVAADPAPPGGSSAAAAQQEARVAAAAAAAASGGLLEAVWQRFWGGALVVGVGNACALLGRQPALQQGSNSAAAPAVLPWYLVRAGGGADGWATLHAALTAAPASPDGNASGSGSPLRGVGVLRSGCWVANPVSGRAEMLVAPCRDVLVATAAWNAAHDPSDVGLEEGDDEFGFYCELAAQ